MAAGVVLSRSRGTAEIPRPGDAAQPRTPARSASAFHLPEGFRMEVVASEPLIASPSGLCWDERGRLFVTELHGYNLEGALDIEELNKTGQLDTQVRRVQADERFQKAAEPGTYGVVKRLHDDDGDGRMDRADVWADRLPPAYGLVPARGGVIVACAPHILYLADRDGDGTAEVREMLFTGFATGALERGINAPQWGDDGWIYFGRGHGGGTITGSRLKTPVELPGSDFRIRADGTAIEPVTGDTGTFGFAITASGDRFTMSTSEPGRWVAPLPWRYLIRNPNAAIPPLQVATGDRRVHPLAAAHPWRQKRADHAAYAKYYRDRYGAGDSDASGWFTSACSPLIYRDAALPGLQGQYLVCEPSGNLIHRAMITEDGPLLRLQRVSGEAGTEFAASADSWSHPMNLLHGPDGAVWVVDYYREIIEDYSAIPRHLQQQYGLYAGHDRGRIYRLTPRDLPRPPAAAMDRLEGPALAAELASPIWWRRATAGRLLVEQGDPGVAPAIRRHLQSSAVPPAVAIAALRTLEGLNGLAPGDLLPFLGHSDPDLRIQTLRMADPWFSKPEGREILGATLSTAGSETHARVRLQLALSLGESRDPAAFDALVRMARTSADIRWMDIAILSSVHGREADLLAALLRDPGAPAGFLAALSRTIAAGRDDRVLGRTLSLLETAPSAVQTAVLDGLARGRQGARKPPVLAPEESATLTRLTRSPEASVRTTAEVLASRFTPETFEEESDGPANPPAPAETVSEDTFRKFVAALSRPRDPAEGRRVFLQACAPCHRVGSDGHAVGPDLLAQVGIAEEGLLKEILMPGERIRPGYETTRVRTTDGMTVAGILREDGATSLTLSLPNGADQVVLRKDVREMRRLPGSIMPAFGDALTPEAVANLLSWLRAGGPAPGGMNFASPQ